MLTISRKLSSLHHLLYISVLFILLRFDYQPVIHSGSNGLFHSFTNDYLFNYASGGGNLEKEMTRHAEIELYLHSALQSFRNRPPSVQFNAELAVLPASSKNPVRNPLSIATPASSSSLQNLTSAFNANAEALGDLFMNEFHLQSNLDLDEITAVAGFVSKEDLDVQRLVDVLWSQDVDLGIGRENYEYTILQPKTQGTSKPEKLESYLVPSVYNSRTGSHSRDFEQRLVDDETGEFVTKPASGNDTRDPNVHQIPNTTHDGLPFGYGPVPGTSNVTATEQQIEERELQSLIDALNSLNSSSLQAVVNQSKQSDQAIAERWQDVQSVITQPSFPSQGNIPIPVPTQYSTNAPVFPPSNIVRRHPSIAPTQPNQNSTQVNSELKNFDLFSMFMDPPTNWTLPAPASPMRMNLSDYLTFPSSSYDSSYSQSNSSLTNRPLDYFGNVSSNGSIGMVLQHEGPFDFSGFSYPQTPIRPDHTAQQVPSAPFAAPLANQTNLFDWSLPDWHGVGMDLQEFSPMLNVSSGSVVEQNNGLNQSGVNNSDWKLLQDLAGHGNSGSNNLLSLDDSKLRLLDLDTVPNNIDLEERIVKEENLDDPDPWSTHVSFAAGHNHTYSSSGREGLQHSTMNTAQAHSSQYLGLILSAFEQLKTGRNVEYQVTLAQDSSRKVEFRRLPSRSRSRERSEDRRSVTGSTGSGSTSNGRSRQSRDDWAASEMNLPVTAEDIINMPVEEFNSYISGNTGNLHGNQIQLMKDIRRRGKNKVAAQNCRKRKIEGMTHLEREIMELRDELEAATIRRDQLARERDRCRALLRASVIQSTSTVPPAVVSSRNSSVIVMSGGSAIDFSRRKEGTPVNVEEKPRKRKREDQ